MISNVALKPHRGRASVMAEDKKNIVLDNGEIFIEIPDTVTDDNQYKIKIGDGVTTYENLPYAVDPSNINVDTSTISTDTSTNMSTTRKDDVLAEGELFLEAPDSLTGDNQYKIKIGDGITTYENLPYAVDPTNISSGGSGGNTILTETRTLSTTTTTTYTFTDSSITTDSIIDVYTSIYGISPNSMSASTGTCTVVFPVYSSASSMTVKIVVIN